MSNARHFWTKQVIPRRPPSSGPRVIAVQVAGRAVAKQQRSKAAEVGANLTRVSVEVCFKVARRSFPRIRPLASPPEPRPPGESLSRQLQLHAALLGRAYWDAELVRARGARPPAAAPRRWHDDSRLEFLLRNRDRFATEIEWERLSQGSASVRPGGLRQWVIILELRADLHQSAG